MVFEFEIAKETEGRGRIRIGFVEERSFRFGAKDLWRDRKTGDFGASSCQPDLCLNENRLIDYCKEINPN